MTAISGHAPSDALDVTPALEIDDLTSGYDGTAVLRRVSMQIHSGSVTALLGPNGSGKSTLLRTVSGFVQPSRGSIRLFGRDVTRSAPHRRAQLGLCHVPEGRGIFRSLTVRDNLVMQARSGMEADAIERAVAAFPVLGQRLQQTAGTLSGGQQQMLAIAAAYVREPRLILVDEASLGLAPVVVDEIFAFMATVTESGASLLIVDQFITRALALATHAYVLRKGEVVHSGAAGELLESDVFATYLGSG